MYNYVKCDYTAGNDPLRVQLYTKSYEGYIVITSQNINDNDN